MTEFVDRNLRFEEMSDGNTTTKGITARSTAAINVEDAPISKGAGFEGQTFEEVQSLITGPLLASDDPQISIYVHGYSVNYQDAKKRVEDLFKTARSQPHPGQVVIGFYWPSENPTYDTAQEESGKNKQLALIKKIKQLFEALPTILVVAFVISLVLGLVGLGLTLGVPAALSWPIIGWVCIPVLVISLCILFFAKALSTLWMFIPLNGLIAFGLLWLTQVSNGSSILVVISAIALLILGAMLCLLIMRFSTYLRDRERASYYAVYDLVELIRKIDLALYKAKYPNEENPRKGPIYQPRVKLNFMAHSLGNLVITNTIRILSDVFDSKACLKNPSRNLGNTLTLERIVLVAPDIPIEAILPGRSNFLSSTISRAKESYVFSNEGDLALRLASTAANFLGYFSRERFGGYRLGNVTVNRDLAQDDSGRPMYGILNLSHKNYPHELLNLRASNKEKETLNNIVWDRQPEALKASQELKAKTQKSLNEEWNRNANQITYFDCTDYKDVPASDKEANSANGTSKAKTVSSRALLTNGRNRNALSFFDYGCLLISYIFSVDTHGGYFKGQFSQQLLHKLMLIGFNEYLKQEHDNDLNNLDSKLREKRIQTVLSHTKGATTRQKK